MRQRHSGYILVMTIAALALLALVGAYVGQRISTALHLAVAEQDFARQEKQARDAIAQADFLLATTRRTAIGLGGNEIAIRLDGRWYDMGNGMALSLQDARGLINLQTAPRMWREALLTTYGIKAEANATLLDTLEDYVDDDDLRRLQGAEKGEYLARHMLPPRNQPLVSTTELARVYGWGDAAALWNEEDPILNHVVLASSTGVNPATATWRTLVAALGMSNEEARNFIQARKDLSTEGMRVLASPYVKAVDMLQTHKAVLFPSTTVVITIAVPDSRRAWRSTMTITPDGDTHGWRSNDLQEFRLASAVERKALLKMPNVSAYRIDIEEELKKDPFASF
ncbi:Type II secretory pathway, component PulK [Andreprevotia lacus DSM 23236]|jgi:type II secretory pathway component PulK|uniref:Type II secretory pathway, component PulK n=1 Tax=Andreprevotia lacus DSM 23236 TaxID=1121001 RepID=A0A1W1XZI4_9NEIS|nr:type II secretion system protein GspK [Andreprevotia lacus]SMC28941.1 Type II secretory pathway, component PulK [Andreprevotia lacus DSM 23236]